MPYGLPKELDTPANNAKIERCVSDLVSKGQAKSSAIRICKNSLIESHKKKGKSDN